MKPIVFLDMDGVLADYFTAVFDAFDLRLDDYKAQKPWKYAIHEWIAEMDGKPMIHETLYPYLYNRDAFFWEHIPLYPWTTALLETVKSMVGEENVFIVTHPQPDGLCYAGKLAWIQRHLNIRQDHIIFCTHKHLLSKRNTVLIDDCTDNCYYFSTLGLGNAILFPQPWNVNQDLIPVRESWPIENLRRIIDAN